MADTQNTKLTNLLNAANKYYDESYLTAYFNVATGGRRAGSGDTLAGFIVSEVRESFDGKASRERQVAAAVDILEQAKKDIQNAIDGLRELAAELVLGSEA